jgi:hypothetical protein
MGGPRPILLPDFCSDHTAGKQTHFFRIDAKHPSGLSPGGDLTPRQRWLLQRYLGGVVSV